MYDSSAMLLATGLATVTIASLVAAVFWLMQHSHAGLCFHLLHDAPTDCFSCQSGKSQTELSVAY